MDKKEIARLSELNDFTEDEKAKLAKDEPLRRPYLVGIQQLGPAEPSEIEKLKERLARLEAKLAANE